MERLSVANWNDVEYKCVSKW